VIRFLSNIVTLNDETGYGHGCRLFLSIGKAVSGLRFQPKRKFMTKREAVERRIFQIRFCLRRRNFSQGKVFLILWHFIFTALLQGKLELETHSFLPSFTPMQETGKVTALHILMLGVLKGRQDYVFELNKNRHFRIYSSPHFNMNPISFR
jgi:hypothetical protein